MHIIGKNPTEKISLEWFDRELDSILLSSQTKNERIFVDSVHLPKRSQENPTSENESPDRVAINTELLRELRARFDEIVLIGCDFLREKDTLTDIATYHLSELSSRE